MTYLKNVVALLAFACASSAMAQPKAEALEPLPTDPKKRIYYGELYDPEQYAKCIDDWAKQGGDPRVKYCDIYRERLEPFDPKRREEFGEFYNPAKFHECRARVHKNDMQCEYLKLRRVMQPEHWPYPNLAKPKLPDGPNPPVYKRGMNAKQYFEALCKAEAGEFIYKTLENVEGVYQVRPRAGASHYTLRDRYVMEDPYGFTQGEADNAPAIFLGPKKYRFFEVPVERERMRDPGLDTKYFDASMFLRPRPGDKVARYLLGKPHRDSRDIKKEHASKLKSRHGYTWREIKRPRDREYGIVGGELIVLDLTTNEVLGIRRGFMLAATSSYSKSGLSWDTGTVCPRLQDRPGWPKDFDFTYWFVSKVLKPATRNSGGNNGAERK